LNQIAGRASDPNSERVAVVLDHKERKVANAFKMLRELYGDKKAKEEQEKKKRVASFLQKKQGEEERKMKKQKEARKQISRYVQLLSGLHMYSVRTCMLYLQCIDELGGLC
jgi:hypothetical protein